MSRHKIKNQVWESHQICLLRLIKLAKINHFQLNLKKKDD